MQVKQPAIYIMANKRNGTIYTGVTNDLIKRVYEHKYGDVPGFTQEHGCKFLVYYELIEDMISAIAREKQFKGGLRKKKLALIEKLNPYWEDLYEKLLCQIKSKLIHLRPLTIASSLRSSQRRSQKSYRTEPKLTIYTVFVISYIAEYPIYQNNTRSPS
ncbi:GIY-YIG nuclease superfamily protein [Legionella pneumophila]|nr:GIY-YIG nuclease superfamily protein [Legionella pneumophila]